MSVKLMTEVFSRYPVGGGEMLLALALADHSHDDGRHIWPSVSSLAEKTRQSVRAVQYQLRKMEACGWLIRVPSKNARHGRTVEYCINSEWIKGADFAPLTDQEMDQFESSEGAKSAPSKKLRVQSTTSEGAICDIVYKEEPSVEPSVVVTTVTTPPLAPSKAQQIEFDTTEGLFKNVSDQVMQRWEEAYPKLDIDAELTRAELWYVSNPRKRKKNHHRFLTNWLARAHTRLTSPPPRRPFTPARPSQ